MQSNSGAPLPYAKKSLGQNFLTDKNIIRRIVDAINPQPGEVLVEIGPGPGALTQGLLAAGAHVIAIEKDQRMAENLEAMAKASPGTLSLHITDALEVDWATLLASHKPVKLVGNLPYNVGTQIVFAALERPQLFSRCTFMLQKEVVERIVATPGDKQWGRLGVWSTLLSDSKKLFDVPPGAFRPQPKVTSSIVQITPLAQPRIAVDIHKLEKVLRLSFGQRRKMLRATLKPVATEAQIEALGIAPTARPETLSVAELVQLTSLV